MPAPPSEDSFEGPMVNVSRASPRDPAGGPRRTNTDAVRVLCVDDHAVLIEGLKAQFAIDGGIRVVGRLSSADELLEEFERLKPDVVLLDIEMPGADAFEMAGRVRDMFRRARIIFLSAHIRDGYVSAAYKCGASGYFAKSDDLEAIAAGVREVTTSASGAFVMGPKVKEHCRPAAGPRRAHGTVAAGRAPETPLDRLTVREIEVLRLIGKGLSRTEIATELCRSAKTIDGHQERMIKKLCLETRGDLMRFAIREGLAEA